jgi:hypothetical protein
VNEPASARDALDQMEILEAKIQLASSRIENLTAAAEKIVALLDEGLKLLRAAQSGPVQ